MSGAIYSGNLTPAFDSSSGLEYYISESSFDKSTNTFTHNRTGFININNGIYTSRNGTEGYHVYRIDTYDL